MLTQHSSVSQAYTVVSLAWAPRNRNEAQVLAEVIDMVRLGARRRDILRPPINRLTGVHLSEKTGQWTMADVLARKTEDQAFIDAATFRKLVKLGSHIQQATRENAAPAPSSKQSGAGGAYNGGWSKKEETDRHGPRRDGKDQGRNSGAGGQQHDAKSSGSKH